MPHVDARSRFLEVLAHEWFASSGSLWLEQSTWEEEALVLSLVIEPWEGEPHQKWKVRVNHAFEERLSGAWADDAYLGTDHPGLIPWKEEEVDIYFTQNRMPAREVLGIAAAACACALEDFYPLTRFLNAGLGLLGGECGSHGLLGRFPGSVASAILDALPSDLVSVQALNRRPPSYWDGAEHRPYPSTLEILTFGNSHVVGAGFTFDAA
jgi:hypothetical protein